MNSTLTEIEKYLWDAADWLRSLGVEDSGAAASLFYWWYGLQ